MWQSAATVAILMLMVCPVFADSPTTVINAVQNTGNTSGQAAVGTSGNVNQNTNQNSLGTSSATSVNIGGINVQGGGGVGAAGTAGAGEGYVGYTGSTSFASPSITFGSSRITNVNLPGIPGVLGAPGNFSQPYKPDVFINGAGPIRPASMTYDQAKECRGGYGYKDTYTGANREKAKEIKLVYAAWDKIDISTDMSNYVGISSVEGADKPWLPAVCEAAYHAMEKGANFGVVMIQLTGLKVPTVAAVAPPVVTPAVAAPAPPPMAAPALAPTAPQVPKGPEEGRVVVPNGKQPVKIPSAPQPQGDVAPPADPGRTLNVPGQPQPSDPGQVLTVPGQPQPADPGRALSVPGQPAPSDPGQVLTVPGQPQPADPGQKLGVPGQPQPADPGQVLSVPGQPQQQPQQLQPQPAADTGQRPLTSQAQPLSRLNPVGDSRGPR
ncbi:MAG: hypothetical protein DME16_20885 [Candidatus Rokuibacteriota bacterium]|nr:MAG: hypothetical protein DME16_20885 [Candidatus Rokubacteria bacterium]